MKAIEIIEEYVKEDVKDNVGIIAISQEKDNMFWYHVHDDEEIPEDFDIAIHIRKKDLKK